MSTSELFVSAARRCLSTGRKSLSVPQSLDLAIQVSAVDLRLKPAVLYDSNGACAEQVQHYLNSLQSHQLVSESLLTLDLNGNSLIVNPVTVRSHLEKVLQDRSSVAVIDVCHSQETPTVADPLRGELTGMIQDLLLLLEKVQQLDKAERLLSAGEKCEEWNLCTAFGLLLGYPVTYWFDHTKSFDNCLSMTPLMVVTASATWQEDTTAHRCRLYSFSVPAALQEEMQPILVAWTLRLQQRFGQQNLLKDLTINHSTVTLPSVCL